MFASIEHVILLIGANTIYNLYRGIWWVINNFLQSDLQDGSLWTAVILEDT